MTTIIRSVEEWISVRTREVRARQVGFIPTMGALHEGHQSLIERSMRENDLTVVSIFVNPTQFNSEDDFRMYPRSDEKDFSRLSELGVNYVFFPNYEELYPDNFTYKISEHALSLRMEGVGRPGHFDGVLTVVMKLLNIIQPARGYFGEKDFQQYTLVSKMCKAFFLQTEIIMCPTIRDIDGLALSSRNQLLSAEDRKRAALFPVLLRSDKAPDAVTRELESAGFKVAYITEVDGRRFGAVCIGKVRLIDNVELTSLAKQ